LWTDDRCAWNEAKGLDGLYVTQLAPDPITENGVWATSSSGNAHNALWWSEDGGASWTAHSTFGKESTVRGMALDETGPRWAMGWRSGLPYAWHTEDVKNWTEISLEDLAQWLIYPLGMGPDDQLYVRLTSSDKDILTRIDTTGEVTELLEFTDDITAFSHTDVLAVGSRTEGLYTSTDDGKTFDGPTIAPEPGCLVDFDGARYLCAHNWSDDAAVLRTFSTGANADAWEWEEVLWLGNVRGVESCPADSPVAQLCEPIWEKIVASAGFDETRELPVDTGQPAADTGTPDGEDCGCRNNKASLILLLPLGWFVRRAEN